MAISFAVLCDRLKRSPLFSASLAALRPSVTVRFRAAVFRSCAMNALSSASACTPGRWPRRMWAAEAARRERAHRHGGELRSRWHCVDALRESISGNAQSFSASKKERDFNNCFCPGSLFRVHQMSAQLQATSAVKRPSRKRSCATCCERCSAASPRREGCSGPTSLRQ